MASASPQDRSSSLDENLLEIRKTIIVAIASDETLMERLVLKGGNALDIIYKIGERSSLDVDFSMVGDFKDDIELRTIRERLYAALRDRFDSLGYVVFDEKFEPRPLNHKSPGVTIWGGYGVYFKLIPRGRFLALGGVAGTRPDGKLLEAIRREAQTSGPRFQRVFSIEISKFEYCTGRALTEIDGFDC